MTFLDKLDRVYFRFQAKFLLVFRQIKGFDFFFPEVTFLARTFGGGGIFQGFFL